MSNPQSLAESVYATYTQYFREHQSALKHVVSDEEIGGAQEVRAALGLIDLEVDFVIGDPAERDFVQDALDIRAETVQKGIVSYKNSLKEMKVAGALARLNISIIAANSMFERVGNVWHEEARALNELRP